MDETSCKTKSSSSQVVARQKKVNEVLKSANDGFKGGTASSASSDFAERVGNVMEAGDNLVNMFDELTGAVEQAQKEQDERERRNRAQLKKDQDDRDRRNREANAAAVKEGVATAMAPIAELLQDLAALIKKQQE